MSGWTPPPYPYDRLAPLKELAAAHPDGLIDCSIGTPFDQPPDAVRTALAESSTANRYPPSIGTEAFRSAAAGWLNRLCGTTIGADDVRATVGSKELVAGLPQWLHLRDPERDTVLYPAVSYPSYAMGAELAGLRAVPVPLDDQWRPRLDAIAPSDSDRALCLWVNSPGNPTGSLTDLAEAAAWGRSRGVPVLSDECYVAFTWAGPPSSILQSGLDGVLAVHSLSKRSNLAGARVGFYAGDPELVGFLGELRKHAGFMVPGPNQEAAVVAFGDESHVDEQRARYLERLALAAEVVSALGGEVEEPEGGFYLWARSPDGDGWTLATEIARRTGVLVSPGEFYGAAGADRVRVAVVQPTEKLRDAKHRLAVSR